MGGGLAGIGKQQQSKYQVNACGSPLGEQLETKSGNGSLPSNGEFCACAAYFQYQFEFECGFVFAFCSSLATFPSHSLVWARPKQIMAEIPFRPEVSIYQSARRLIYQSPVPGGGNLAFVFGFQLFACPLPL